VTTKTPIQVLLQKLGTLRLNELSLLNYNDEVEKTLTILTNKTIMTNGTEEAANFNEKFRDDAHLSFASGP